MTEMTKEDLKQELLKADAKAAEVEEVLAELAGDLSDESINASLEKVFGQGAPADEMSQILGALKNQVGGAVMLQTMTSLLTVAAKSVAIAKFMGVDPEVLKNLFKNNG